MNKLLTLALAMQMATSTLAMPASYAAATMIAVALLTVPTDAMACDSTEAVGTACDLERLQSNRPDSVGRKAVTNVPMACLSVLSNAPAALVLAEGEVAQGESVSGRPVTSWRMQANVWTKLASGQYMREICIPIASIRPVMTLCDDVNRSVWHANDTAALIKLRRIPASNPTCMLGKKACAQFGL